MTFKKFLKKKPQISAASFVHQTAVIIGDVLVEENSSIWPYVVLRADMNFIKIGKNTNIQDGTIIHNVHQHDYNTSGAPVTIGDNVTIGHKCVIHGARIMDNCLIGIGSIILDDALVEKNVIIAANSMVKAGAILESGYYYSGNPAQKIRPLSDFEYKLIADTAINYADLKNEYTRIS